jgi:hypothetical protein
MNGSGEREREKEKQEMVMEASYSHPERTEENSVQEQDFLLNVPSFQALKRTAFYFFSLSLSPDSDFKMVLFTLAQTCLHLLYSTF